MTAASTDMIILEIELASSSPISNVGSRTRGCPSLAAMIRFILLQNRQGKTRLSKWYVPFNAVEKFKIESEIHRAVVTRDPRNTNFLEYRSYKIIYRRYAGMFFIFCASWWQDMLQVHGPMSKCSSLWFSLTSLFVFFVFR